MVAVLLTAGAAIAQGDKLTYTLTNAKVNVVKPECKSVIVQANLDLPVAPCQEIEVLFGSSVPDKAATEDTNNWLVMAIDENGKDSFRPRSVAAGDDGEVMLTMGEDLNPGGKLDRFSHRIIITYQQHNLPTTVLGLPKRKKPQKVFTAAKGAKDADIYFNGSATGQRGSGPIYSIEAKAGYLQSLRKAGAIGGRATFVSDAGADIDPDSVTASATYEKVWVIRSPWGIIINSDFLGGEFDKENKTRNLTTELDGTLVFPSKRIGENSFATMDFMGGFEGGHNYKHALNPKGLGNIWRPKFGVNAYFVALAPKFFNRINLSANYIVRLPQTAEPFTKKINGVKVNSLTTRPRHHVGIDLGLMFAPSYGLTISYRYGSLPPDFKMVDHKVSVGFTLQLKQANR
jgi:hypothetical protein